MIFWDAEYLNWLVNDSIKRRKKNMCNVKVSVAKSNSAVDSVAVTWNRNDSNNYSWVVPHYALDGIIQALTTYRDNLPKPCVHAELIKQYAEDCQKYERPWELWERKMTGVFSACFTTCVNHPTWSPLVTYRRKQDLSEVQI